MEAKILDRAGRLDLPDGIGGRRAGLVLIADHQFPGDLGPVHPLQMREAIAGGEVTAEKVIGCLIEAIGGALAQASAALPQRLQLAHLFSILPKMGLAESGVPDAALSRLARRGQRRRGAARGEREVGLPVGAHGPRVRGGRGAAGGQHRQPRLP